MIVVFFYLLVFLALGNEVAYNKSLCAVMVMISFHPLECLQIKLGLKLFWAFIFQFVNQWYFS
jgi:hypothetical protein